jgi:uncharacterized surface protein with fasciclin (FAS1) repeats
MAINQKLLSAGIALIVLPILASCAQETAQTPAEAPVAQTSPDVTTAPSTEISPIPSTTATTATDVVSVVANDPSLSTLKTAITATGLGEELKGAGPYTIFAPSDQAFAALPESTRQELLLPENRDELRQLLSYHVVAGELTSDQLSSGPVQSLEGEPLNVSVNQPDAQVRVNNATVSQADIPASNGVIHVVDQVILPPNLSLN